MSPVTKIGLAASAAALCLFAMPPAMAQTSGQQAICAPIEALTTGLYKQYREMPVATATTQNSYEVALFRSADRKTWTLVAVTQDGVGCLLDVGTDWRDLPSAPKTKAPGASNGGSSPDSNRLKHGS